MIDIKLFRRANKISQQKLADYCGITQGAISQWESGLTKIPSDLLEKLLNNQEGWDTTPLMTGTSSVQGNNNTVNNGHDQKITADAKLVEALNNSQSAILKSQEIQQKSQEQIDRLLGIIEKLTKTQ